MGAISQEAAGFWFTQFMHRTSHHSVTRCSGSSVWDDSVIPHTLCNILEKPMGHVQQKLCILLPSSLTWQMQGHIQACFSHTNHF